MWGHTQNTSKNLNLKPARAFEFSKSLASKPKVVVVTSSVGAALGATYSSVHVVQEGAGAPCRVPKVIFEFPITSLIGNAFKYSFL